MKTIVTLFLFGFLLLSLSACKDGKAPTLPPGAEGLVGCWTDSREENAPGSKSRIYRPCDYKVFPLTWFRFEMDLKADLSCKWLFLAPDDGHFMKDGTWKYDPVDKSLRIFDLDGGQVEAFVVSAVEQDRLVFE